MEKIKEWVWCLHCERVFQIELSRAPEILTAEEEKRIQDYSEGCFSFAEEFEAQFGKADRRGIVYAECPYDDCDGSLLDFYWWRKFRMDELHPGYPEEPCPGCRYPMYPER